MQISYYVWKCFHNGNKTGNIFFMGTIYNKGNLKMTYYAISKSLFWNYSFIYKGCDQFTDNICFAIFLIGFSSKIGNNNS